MKLYEAFGTMLVALAVIGCQSTCEEAQEKFDTCQDEIAEAHMGQTYSLPFTGVSDECNELDQCVPPCILKADCAAMAAAIASPAQTDPNERIPPGKGEFLSCIDPCIREATRQ